jgi:putative tricarboxylic transport membrane protein
MTFGKWFDALTGIILLGVAIYVYVESSTMPQVPKGLGPGGYPVFVAAGLALLSVILIIQSLVRYAKDKNPMLVLSKGSLIRVAWFVVLAFIYLSVLPYTGFILTSIPLLVYLAYFYGYRRWWMNVLTNTVVTLGIYMLFRHFFLVLLPTGSLFG